MKTTLLLAFALAMPAAAAGQVHMVDASGGPGSQYTEIQAAVTAAAPGDTILVRTGGYQKFVVQDKGLVITADRGAFVSVAGFIVKDVPLGQSLRIHGLQTFSLNNGPGLTVTNCSGPVWIEDCVLAGAQQSSAPSWSLAAEVKNSSAVSFHRSTLSGSFSLYTVGGTALLAFNSQIALFDCNLTGGRGGSDMFTGYTLAAGPGALVHGGTLYASGTSFTGGQGGSGIGPVSCEDADDGAAGLVLNGGVRAHLLDSPTTGGLGGTGQPGCADGVQGPGQTILSGALLEQAFPARSLQAPNPVRAGQTLTLTIDGVPGDAALLWLSALQTPFYVPPLGDPLLPLAGGVFLPGVRGLVLAVGTLTPGGLQVQLPFQNLGVPALELYAQAVLISGAANGGIVASSGQGITLLAAGL